MQGNTLLGLAALAGRMVVVAAADPDAWQTAGPGFAGLVGRGDAKQTQLAERRLEETRQQVTGADTADAGRIRGVLAARWAGRLEDLLEENPGAEADLRTLVHEVQAALRVGMVPSSVYAADPHGDRHGGAANGGTAAKPTSGSVAPPNPTRLGPGRPSAGSEILVLEERTAVAVQGGVAAGELADQRPQAESRPVRLPPRPVFLAGRETLLAELDARLTEGAGPEPRTVVLRGPEGFGKTSVAVEHAHRRLADGGVVWQLAAGDAAVLAVGFAELAAQLGAEGIGGNRNPVAAVHRVLARSQSEWLLLFDNAPDMASVEALVPPAGPGRVLITSQHQFWPTGQVLDVPVLGPEGGAEFLITRTGDQDWPTARELAGKRELGGLPLALEQAVAYVRATGDTLTAYLTSFRHRRADLLARGIPAGLPDTVATTWALTFERLQHAHPDAVALLRLLACCGPEPIPLRLLLQLRPGVVEQIPPQLAPAMVPLLVDRLAATDAVAVLRQYSLISPAADGSVSVHPLVQAATVDQMSEELAAVWRQAAADVIEAALLAEPEEPEAWPDYAALLPHVRVVLAPDSGGMAKIATYLGKNGSYAAAIELGRKMLEARASSLGSKHADTLGIRYELAYWTGQAGHAAAARDQFATLVPVLERVLGTEHPDTLASRASLADWTGQAGDAAAARDQFTALLPVLERILGPEHPDTLISRHNLANFVGHANDAAGARDQFAALLPVREEASGPDHAETLAARFSLAYWTGQAGDAAAARDQFTALLPVRERVSGPHHPYTLAARRELANWTGRAGDTAGARDRFAALLPVYERIAGPADPYTLTIRASLAYWTAHAGDAAAARDQYAALLPVREQVLGPEHPDTLATRHQLAYWTAQAGDPAAARHQFAELLPARERVLGPKHPDTLATRSSLAHLKGESRSARAQPRRSRRPD
jgi:hypothetical protein